MTHVAELARGRWLYYVAVCSCGHKAKGWTADKADRAMDVHLMKEADKDD